MIRFDDILEKVSPHFQEEDITLLKKAYVFAARAHKGQVRRSGEPYMSHPLEVTALLADMKLDLVTLAAGLLHDVLEDTDISAEELRREFGKEITDLVEGVTKITRVQTSSPEARQAESIRKIILAMTDDLRVIFIKLADRLHNLKTLKFLPEDKQRQVAEETLEIYVPIANRLGMGRMKAELEDLSFRYVSPGDFFQMMALIEPRRKQAAREISGIKKTLEELLKKHNIPAEVQSRIKRPYSIFSKMTRQHIDFDQVYDFMAVRIITDSVKNCYAVLGLIHQKWPHFPHRFHDFISMPKANLYQALHTTILAESNQTVEVQIRTRAMHSMAEEGIAAHWKYKEQEPPSLIQEDARLNWLRDMAEIYREQKSPREFLKNLKGNLLPEEVYVFTPKRKVITLPTGSTALDFAFKVHTEIGYRAQGAIINGKHVPLKTSLKTGDIVEIITAPEEKPSREWLNHVVTSKARHCIKHWFLRQDRARHTSQGKKMWEKALKKYGLPAALKKESVLLERLRRIPSLRVPDIAAFHRLLGSGKIIADQKFFEYLSSPEGPGFPKETFLDRMVKKVSKKPPQLIKVGKKGEPPFRLASCCSPIKGEPIIGYITSGRGITVHAQRCVRVQKELLNPLRVVEASWDASAKGSYLGRLLIRSRDAPGVLARLTAEIARLGANIARAQVDAEADNTARIKLSIVIRDIGQLNRIVENLSGIKEVLQVERI